MTTAPEAAARHAHDDVPASSFLIDLVARFTLGIAWGTLACYAAFGRPVLRPDEPAFESLILVVLVSAMLALASRGRLVEAAVLIPAFAMIRYTFAMLDPWRIAIAALLLAVGMWLAALVFQELELRGIRFGKFLLVGPLLGGVCLAVAPLSELDRLSAVETFRPLMFQLFTGIVVGDGVGLGVELAGLIPSHRRTAGTRGRGST